MPIFLGLEEFRKYLVRRGMPGHNLMYDLTVY
jgi:hypothetical protein